MDGGLSLGEWAATIAKQVPKAKYWVAERLGDQIGICVILETPLGKRRFSIRFPDNPTETDLKEAAMNLNGRIEQHAGEVIS